MLNMKTQCHTCMITAMITHVSKRSPSWHNTKCKHKVMRRGRADYLPTRIPRNKDVAFHREIQVLANGKRLFTQGDCFGVLNAVINFYPKTFAMRHRLSNNGTI